MIYLNYYCKKVVFKLKRFGFISKGGRNFLGRICVKGRGNGKKKIYRLIDFFRRINYFGVILKILYDCNRSCFLALVAYQNGLNSFILATENLIINDIIFSGNLPSIQTEKILSYNG